MIRAKKLSPVELTKAVLERIERLNPALNAFCTLTPEASLAAAREAEQAVMSAPRWARCTGLPYSIKDLANTPGVKTMMGSHIFASRVPDADAPVRAPAARGGRDLHRQDDVAGVRLEGARRQPAHRHHA
jgi:aspartyl-tRNA(Asn)/glutamyl-tRNA(Gln) amidotransferase subunit A